MLLVEKNKNSILVLVIGGDKFEVPGGKEMVFTDMILLPKHLNYQAGYTKGYTTGFQVRVVFAAVLLLFDSRTPLCIGEVTFCPGSLTFGCADVLGLQGGVRCGHAAG